MKRREFLINGGALAAAASVPSISQADSSPSIQVEEGLSILQGLTTKTTTQLSVDVPRDAVYSYTLTDVETGKVFDPDKFEDVAFGNHSWRVDKMKFVGLELGHQYHLVVRDTESNQIMDDRYLKTVDLDKKNARVGIISCQNDGKSALKHMWPAAERANLDYFFFIGDNVYGDFLIFRGPRFMWNRYINSRKKIPFYHWKNLKPVVATWDDHDFGKNDGGGDYVHKDYSYHIFKTFFAQDPEGEVLMNGYANSCYFQAFNHNFVFFDNRYYREQPNSLGQQGFMGIEQIDWMTEAVSARPKPTLVMSGSPLYGRFQKISSYQSTAPEEMEYYIKKLRSWNCPLVFAGGDLHYSEVSAIDKSVFGFNTYEIISSCMHSYTKKNFYDNPNPHMGGYLSENFVIMENTTGGLDPQWEMTCVAKDVAIPFQLDLKIS